MRRLLPLFILITLAEAGPGPKAGTAFDLSIPFPIPGSLGRLVADGPDLRFEKDAKGTRRVLVGTNLTGMACFPATDQIAVQWSADLKRRGYNVVRFHHIDWVFRDRGWDFKVNADRFIAALKKNGIYVTIDLFSERAADPGAFKRGVLSGDARIRADWASYAEKLLSQPSQAKGCAAWKDEPAIFGICPLNEDDPRFLNVPPSRYDSAYRWMLGKIRGFGYDGLVWGLNSGIDPQFLNTARLFNVEDFHTYWDHPHGEEFLNTSGVRQYWQFPERRLPGRPWFCTEWGSLPYNRFRGETGLFFAAQMERLNNSCVISYALATNEAQMGGGLAQIDQMAFHTDPVRLATERVMVMLLRRGDASAQANWNRNAGSFSYRSPRYDIDIEGENQGRRADFLGSLDGKPISQSTKLLLIRFGDAQNSGFQSRLLREKVVFGIGNRGGMPVREIANQGPYTFKSSQKLQAWALDPLTGARKKKVSCRLLANGSWEVRAESINTEIAAS